MNFKTLFTSSLYIYVFLTLLASKVISCTVYNANGEMVGSIKDGGIYYKRSEKIGSYSSLGVFDKNNRKVASISAFGVFDNGNTKVGSVSSLGLFNAEGKKMGGGTPECTPLELGAGLILLLADAAK